MNTDNIKWDQILRFRLIEIISLWEGRLTTNHLCKAFQIGRQQASRDINKYLKLFDAPPLELDRHIKGYKPTNSFSPIFSRGAVGEYLSMLNQQSEMMDSFEFLNFGAVETQVIHVPERSIAPEVIRKLLEAARDQKRVDMDYVSLSSPVIEGRNIVPHTIVNDGVRWHVRAYCEKRKQYRDFVLSRIRNTPEVLDKSEFGREKDPGWNTYVTVAVTTNPYLNKHQQDVVAHDYSMTEGELEITTKPALVQYLVNRLDICTDDELLRKHSTEHQLALSNLAEIKPYLFDKK